MTEKEEIQKKKPLFSSTDLRIIAISLGILSLGLAIAWFGFAFLVAK